MLYKNTCALIFLWWNINYFTITNEKSQFIPKQTFEYNKTIIMTDFPKDQMKCESDPSFLVSWKKTNLK